MSAALVVALDVPGRREAERLARLLLPVTPWMKVGLELFTAVGPDMVACLKDLGCRVFLDLKFHDIPHTVGSATAAAVGSGADICNVHVSGGEAMCRAAARAITEAGRPCLLLGVTVLTSLGEAERAGDIPSQGADYAVKARAWGLDGVVCSGREAALVKAAAGRDTLCLCPGIRPAGFAPGDDQRRVLTPLEAARAGADYLVVGRPVTRAADPAKAAGDILDSYLRE
jgi:orotidine-5'-phosphate decarboxylase